MRSKFTSEPVVVVGSVVAIATVVLGIVIPGSPWVAAVPLVGAAVGRMFVSPANGNFPAATATAADAPAAPAPAAVEPAVDTSSV